MVTLIWAWNQLFAFNWPLANATDPLYLFSICVCVSLMLLRSVAHLQSTLINFFYHFHQTRAHLYSMFSVYVCMYMYTCIRVCAFVRVCVSVWLAFLNHLYVHTKQCPVTVWFIDILLFIIIIIIIFFFFYFLANKATDILLLQVFIDLL